jgi:phosphohistidine phosphatase SixA
MGAKLKSMDIKIDRIMCSAQKRAIMSAKCFRDGYAPEGEKPEVHLYLKGHEKGACH